MEPLAIVTLVLTSSVLASGLTAWVTWLVAKANYKNQYHGRLLEKRLDAYEQVEVLVQDLGGLVQLENGDICPIVLGSGEDRWRRFLLCVLHAGSKSFWLSSTTSGIITKLNVHLLNEVSNRVDPNADVDKDLQRIGVNLREHLREVRMELENSLYRDFKTMSDITRFIDASRPDESPLADIPRPNRNP